MLFEFESASGNMYYATHLMLSEFEQRVNGLSVSDVTFNRLLSEARGTEPKVEQPQVVEIKEPCWVKLRDGSIAYAIRTHAGSVYQWYVYCDDGWYSVTASGAYVTGEENEEDVIKVGEALTDAELLDMVRNGKIKYTGTMLNGD